MDSSAQRLAKLQRERARLSAEYEMLKYIGGLTYAKYQQFNIEIKKVQRKLNYYSDTEDPAQAGLSVRDFL